MNRLLLNWIVDFGFLEASISIRFLIYKGIKMNRISLLSLVSTWNVKIYGIFNIWTEIFRIFGIEMVLNQHAYLYNESEKVDFPIFVLLVPHCALTKALQFYPMQETQNWSNFGSVVSKQKLNFKLQKLPRTKLFM